MQSRRGFLGRGLEIGFRAEDLGFTAMGFAIILSVKPTPSTFKRPKKLKQHPEPESPERTTSVWEDCGVQVLAWVQDSSSGNVVLMLVDICFLLKTSTLALYKT